MLHLKIMSGLLMKRLKLPFRKMHLCNTKVNLKLPIEFKKRKLFTTGIYNKKKNYAESQFSDSDDEYEQLYHEQPTPVRTMYPTSDDPLIEHLNGCESVEEVFNFIKKYKLILTYEHLAQIVLVLWDLQKMFLHINVISNVTSIDTLIKDYVRQLIGREEFEDLLELIKNMVDQFDSDALSTTLLYLGRIGVPIKHTTMQILVNTGRTKLEDCSMTALSQFMVAIFNNYGLSAYLICQDVIPRIYNSIEICESATDLKLLTICMSNLNKIMPEDVLLRYKKVVNEMIDNGLINKYDHTTIIKIASFLNYPQWRDENTVVISKCLMLLKGNLNQLNVQEILLIYEVFHRIQEPADLLNELQRCACKYLHELEEEMNPLLDIRLRLTLFIVSFSSPSQRPHFENMIRKYMNFDLKGYNLMKVNKIMQFLKVTDPVLCKSFWDKLLDHMEHDLKFRNDNFLKICYNYIHFNQNMNYRHMKFEKRINQWLEGEIEQSINNIIPTCFSTMAAFSFIYGMDVSIINYAVNKLGDNWEQLNHVDCMTISKSLELGLELTKNPNLKPRYVKSINETLDKCLDLRFINENKIKVNAVNLLVKSCIYRNKFEDKKYDVLFNKYNDTNYMSTKLIKNITYCLHSTSTLVPKVIDLMVDYVIDCKDNILAFNVEKIAYLSYSLGYIPIRSKEFSKIFADIILRDQEKLSGLSFLNSCLALCYFNIMPETFVKQIFNTTFLEKIDLELQNCYSKDIYPLRVRNRLMQLNRMICIDHPEYNVPWFHQKYVDEHKKMRDMEKESLFTYKVREYLVKMFKKSNIYQNVKTPYGYHIDYVIHLNNDIDETECIKYAILLLREKAFTSFNEQLKGQYQIKTRHLEMFGYRVGYLNFLEWRNLIYGEDKVNYIKGLFLPNVPNIIEINR